MSKNKRNNIREKVEDTLASIDRLEDIEAGPFFYTRVMGNIRSREKKKSFNLGEFFWPAAPVIQKVPVRAFLILLLIFNIITTVFFFPGYGTGKSYEKGNLEGTGQVTISNVPTSEENQYIAAFIEDYGYSQLGKTYDLEIPGQKNSNMPGKGGKL